MTKRKQTRTTKNTEQKYEPKNGKEQKRVTYRK